MDWIVDQALMEDLSSGDPTTDSLIPRDLRGEASVVAKAEGILAGVNVAAAVFRRLDEDSAFDALMVDGSVLRAGDEIARIEGVVSSMLMGERTALNFLRHLSGVATETSKYVKEVSGYRARILDTRKTTPGLRTLEKYAVRMGGGTNHRRNLGDGILIKDTHIEVMRRTGLDLAGVIEKARAGAPHTLKVEVEVEDLDQVERALDAGAEIILLDNMGPRRMAEAVEMACGRAVTEASGNINLQNVRKVAATGVDLISVGALTHSARALDISLDLT
jgi:nicotinate-nucleotide pyrophosphorylase (carboxylating)